MQRKLQAGLTVLALVIVAALAWAAENPTGTWKWETEVNGQKRENTLKLKLEAEKLTGALVGRDGKDIDIEDGKYKEGDLSFKVTRERGGNKIVSKYAGKITGDTIKGKIMSEGGKANRTTDWEAKREKA